MQGLSGRPVAVSRPCLSPSLHPFPALTVQCWLKRICSFLLEHPNILIHRSVISSNCRDTESHQLPNLFVRSLSCRPLSW